MNKEEIYEKMLEDIRQLFAVKKSLSYISGKNELT